MLTKETRKALIIWLLDSYHLFMLHSAHKGNNNMVRHKGGDVYMIVKSNKQLKCITK